MIIREYLPSDCKYLAKLFYQTVHSINAKDYTGEQLNAWATGNVDIEEWHQSLSEHFSLVAMKDGINSHTCFHYCKTIFFAQGVLYN